MTTDDVTRAHEAAYRLARAHACPDCGAAPWTLCAMETGLHTARYRAAHEPRMSPLVTHVVVGDVYGTFDTGRDLVRVAAGSLSIRRADLEQQPSILGHLAAARAAAARNAGQIGAGW